MIIKDVYDTTGITATAGIGTNLYLAKIAMDIVAKHVNPNIIVPKIIPHSCIGNGIVNTAVAKTKFNIFAIKKNALPAMKRNIFFNFFKLII